MKLSAYLLLLGGSALLIGCAPFRERVSWAQYPGAGQSGKCARYAASVAMHLQQKGIPAWYVAYDWRNGAVTGAHAVVIFRDGGSQWKIVDNQTPYPRPLKPAFSVLDFVRQYDAYATALRGDPDINL